MIVIVTSEGWYLTVALICISLITSDVEHLFMCLLPICMSSLEKCLFRVFFCPLLDLFLNWSAWAVCIFCRIILCGLHYLQIFYHIPYTVFSFCLWIPLLCKSFFKFNYVPFVYFCFCLNFCMRWIVKKKKKKFAEIYAKDCSICFPLGDL